MQGLHSLQRRGMHLIIAIFAAFLLSACGSFAPPFAAQIPPTASVISSTTPSRTSVATASPQATATAAPTTTPSSIPTPSPTFVPIAPTATLAPLALSEREAIFLEAWELVRDRYVYEDYGGLDWEAVRAEFAPRVAAAETPEAFYELVREMIDRLDDKHSAFQTPQEVAERDARFEGSLNYAGIGALIRNVPEGGLIMQLARDGPAEQAGLKPRDIVIAIGNTPFTDTEAFGPNGPISAVRGTPGTTVRLTIRTPEGSQREVAIMRQPVASDAFSQVSAERIPGTDVGLLRISTFFLDDLDQKVRAALLEIAVDRPLTGLIIDVRGNSGGRVDLMLNTVALFADGGTIGSTGARNQQRALAVPQGQRMPEVEGLPLVVLIGEDSISAAEMFAAGMRAQGGARLVGTTTAGNTENLRSHTLSDGSQLWLAELIYLQPDGTPNEGRGVQPDRTVAAEWWRYTTNDDPQIQAALEELGAR